MYHKSRSYDIWFLKYKFATDKFLSFWVIFCPCNPLTTWKIKILKLREKKPEDITILQICIKNDNHIMYDSWDMEHERHNFLSFWTVFYPFTPLWTQKIRILKKWKKTPQDITILQICTINVSHMMYGYWEIECNKQTFFVILDHFLPFYSLNNPENQYFEKL